MKFWAPVILMLFQYTSFAQGCCSGGASSPIAGGSSPGVLNDGQIEAATSFQYFSSNRFRSGAKDTIPLFDNFSSRYLYSRLSYGISGKFTFSSEFGYFLNKTQIGRKGVDTISSSGVGDLILFPRYQLYYKCSEKRKIEVTAGAGLKIPLGKYNDSTLVYTNPKTGQQIFTTSPPIVQPTNGSQDFIFYGFFYYGFPKHEFRLFANSTYIKKGWNPLGQKFGDYNDLSIYVGKTLFKYVNITLQVKGEIVKPMRSGKDIDMVALYNIDIKSTGSRKVFIVPQLSFSYKSITVFGLYEHPVYQFVRGTQLITQQQFVTGLSWRLATKKMVCEIPPGEYSYICPMKCEGSASNSPGQCPVCGMDLQKK